mmetsp:Transcript_8796/g.54027  ORF Transcript_8796/g.54027 Transcript_8796/m.54027 type:complete len:143 (+) Transcript_8796:887-1315(+)
MDACEEYFVTTEMLSYLSMAELGGDDLTDNQLRREHSRFWPLAVSIRWASSSCEESFALIVYTSMKHLPRKICGTVPEGIGDVFLDVDQSLVEDCHYRHHDDLFISPIIIPKNEGNSCDVSSLHCCHEDENFHHENDKMAVC